MKTKHYFADIENNRVIYEDSRYYSEDGVTFVPSVTTIISEVYPNPELQRWKENTDKAERDAKTNAGLTRGSNVHNALENLLDGVKISHEDYTLEEWVMIMRGLEFLRKFKVKPIHIEKKLIGNRWAGTVDLICEIGGKTYIVDWKTNNYPSEDTWGLQGFAYHSLMEQPISGVWFVHLNAKTRKPMEMQGVGWKVFDINVEDYKRLWHNLVEVYEFKNPNPRPKNGEFPLTLKY